MSCTFCKSSVVQKKIKTYKGSIMTIYAQLKN